MITEKLTKSKKIALMSVVITYFVVGFLLLVIYLSYLIGANLAGFASLMYLILGWYIMIKKNGLFYVMKIKHD